MATLKNTNLIGTGFIQYPAGTTAQRPSLTASDRAIRFNTDNDANGRRIGMEVWNGSSWTQMAVEQDSSIRPTVISFNATGPATFNVPTGVERVHVLVIGGGGGGGVLGGGGGAGGFVEVTDFPVTPGGTVPIVVGAGGPGSDGTISNKNGANSSFGTLIAYGGGGGSGHPGNGYGGGGAGRPGASGGGAAYTHPGGPGSANDYPTGRQGWPGGDAPGSPPHAMGGGGGASSQGYPGFGYGRGGMGGMGAASAITGTLKWYAGGGGGGGHGPQSSGGFGGVGGGGSGSGTTAFEDGVFRQWNRGYGPPSPGAKNTGGGGGGGGHTGSNPYGGGGNGGPGIVIVRF